jgi:hypothetical protein
METKQERDKFLEWFQVVAQSAKIFLYCEDCVITHEQG